MLGVSWDIRLLELVGVWRLASSRFLVALKIVRIVLFGFS